MIELQLQHDEAAGGSGGFYLRDADGELLGELTYSRVGEDRLSFDHTWVDDSLRGQGRARELLDAAITWLRATSQKAVPVCPYVKSQFEKDPSIADVLAPGRG